MHKSSLKRSLILGKDERLSFVKMTEISDGVLLYRASRDGFTTSAFHSKCDGKENTITIIKSNFDHVFGGYTSAKWSSGGHWIADSTAFIFSLRRNGVSNYEKFKIKNVKNSIFAHASHGPVFGSGHDIHIKDKSNINIGSYSKLGNSYHFPDDNEDPKSFLAGNCNNWLTTEIEVYQIKK